MLERTLFRGLIKFPWNIRFYSILFPNVLNRSDVLVDTTLMYIFQDLFSIVPNEDT